jgi:DNA uptake protein ComE-like DNA-binding protein
LLNVKGFNPQTLFQVNTNTISTSANAVTDIPLYDLIGLDCFSTASNPEGDGKANINLPTLTAQQLAQNAQIPQANAQTIIQQRGLQPNQQFPNLSTVINLPGFQNNQTLIRSVLDRMTTSATERVEGRINVNTATIQVLQTIPGISQDLAEQIVSNRPSGGYRLLSELLTVSGDSAFVGAVADSLCVNSQSFLIRIVGKAGRMTVAIQALVTISDSVPTITRIEDAPFPDMASRWNWQEPATETTLLENQ